MVKNSWPTGVTSWADTVKFAQLLLGSDVHFENYSHRLPHNSNESFLLFAKGACKEPGPFSCIRELIAGQLEEIKEYEIARRIRKKSQQMMSRTSKKVYYYSCQVSKDPCTCRSIFGADAHHSVIPTCSALWTSGDEFKKRFHAILRGNSASFGGHDILPVWFEKTWQVLWNRNEHNRDHGTSPHCDHCKTYSDTGPITSFSFGCGGILTLRSQTSGKGASKMLFQEHGDVLIMAGKF